MKKITFVLSTLASGGAERVVSTLAAQLDRRGWQVSILLVASREQAYQLPDSVRIECLDGEKDQNLPLWKRWPLRIRKIRRMLKELQPDMVISFMAETNIDVCMAAVGLKVPVIVSERNDPRLVPASRSRRFLRKIVYHRADGFVFQTPDARDYFVPRIRRRGTVILNPLTGKLPEVYEGTRDRRIVAVGRLDQQKNYPLLLAAFREFSQKHPQYSLEIFGRGDEEAALREEIQRLGLERNVRLMGFCADVHNAIREAAFFVMSSDFEGMPNALIEAMALGLPCVCTDCPCGGPRMLVENGQNGLLVPVGDRDALAGAMEEMAEDPERAAHMGSQAAAVRKLVDVNTITDQWEEYIRRCVRQ